MSSTEQQQQEPEQQQQVEQPQEQKLDQKLQQSNEVVIEEEQVEQQPQQQPSPRTEEEGQANKTSSEKQTQNPNEVAEQIIKEAEEIKNKGKPLVQQKDYKAASVVYEQALHKLNPNFFRGVDRDIVEKYIQLNNILLNNLAFMYQNLENYQVAIRFSEQVLLTDQNNIKAWYRKAICYKKLNDFERAWDNIKKAQKINGQLPEKQVLSEIAKEYMAIKGEYKEYLEKNKSKEREVYSKMLSSKVSDNTQQSSKVPNTNNSNLNMSKSIFMNNKSNEKTVICLLGSTIVGLTLPLSMGVNLQKIESVGGAVGLTASLFGLSRFTNNTHRIFFTASTSVILGLMYKFAPKAIKN